MKHVVKYILWAGIVCLVLLTAIRPFLVVSSPLPTARSIVLLAGNYEERVPIVASLHYKGQIEKIVVTDDNVRRGWSHKYHRSLYSSERTYEALTDLGVPGQAIVNLPFGKSGTVFDAITVREYILKAQIPEIMIVTSDYHTRRAFWIFKQIFKDTTIKVGITPSPSPFVSLPALKEPFKLIYYWLRFGVMNDFPKI